MASPTIYPVSKGGWRPVVGSGGIPGFAPFQAAPLHAPPAYKIPIPVEQYPSSSRPLAARDAAKMTSMPQHQYRPTTLRSLPASSPPSAHQPINSYLNPFGLQSGLSHYKIVQNFPLESVVIRNPHNPFAARPTFSKYPMKYKQALQFQQLNTVQPIQFGGPYGKPHDIFSKPVEVYVRPTDSKKLHTYKPDPNAPEIFKPEVYKLPDSDSASQNQQVKTAQQQQNLGGNVKSPANIYQQFPFKEEKFAQLPSILGTFNTFGVQSIKGRDPVFPVKQTTYVPPLPTKQTIFNSFSYKPTFKTSPNTFISTTPKLQPTLQHNYNHVSFGSTSDYKVPPTQQVKLSTQLKEANKGSFKASPQDPFNKHQQQLNKYYNNGKQPQVTTYSPTVPTTTPLNHFFSNDLSGRLPSQPSSHNAPFISYHNQNYDRKKHKYQDSYASGISNSPSQYPSPPKKQEFEATPETGPFRPTYDVTELYGDDVITYSSPHSWSPSPDPHYNQYTQPRPADEVVTKTVFNEVNHPSTYTKPTTEVANLPEEYEIVTEHYNNNNNNEHYDTNIETQSHRPLADDFEPIGKHKLKDYYYKVSTPAQTEFTTHYKRNKGKATETPTKPTEAPWDYSTVHISTSEQDHSENLATLPPSLHYKRPSVGDSLDKDKIRKRNKIRRRRPPHNRVVEKEETSTRAYSPSTDSYTTDGDEVHTYRPRPRIPSYNKKPTTPSVTTDLSTSALPTITPTTPTTHVVRKKIRKPTTTPSDRYETTTISYRENDLNRESPIMKIASRDYSHKQDEKDTPTSDVSIITDTTGRSRPEPMKFSFHKDVKPLEAKLELLVKGVEKPNSEVKATTNRYLSETTKNYNFEESTEVVTTTPKVESTSRAPGKITRPRLKSKYEINRPRFSVKDYRNRLNSTTTTERTSEPHVPKLRFPQRRLPFQERNENSTETRKKFIPKEQRNKINEDENSDPTTEREIQSRGHRHRSTTTEVPEKTPSRVRYTQRRKPAEDTTEVNQTKRPLRKKIKDTDISESVQDVSVTETMKEDTSTERKKSESAIMKIAKEEKKDLDAIFEHSKRVSDLTLAASKDYNTPGMFKTVSPNSRRIPNYFTIATDDPILPIEAFFPQLNQKKEA